VIIIAYGHKLPIGAGHSDEQTSGTPQGPAASARSAIVLPRWPGSPTRSLGMGAVPFASTAPESGSGWWLCRAAQLWDPCKARTRYAYQRITPHRLQAWRHEIECRNGCSPPPSPATAG
jgi:hypothetical protein